MNSRSRIAIVVAVSLAVPFLALRHRWSEIRAFAHQWQDLTLSSDEGTKKSTFTSPGRTNGGNAGPKAPAKPEAVIAEALVANSDPAAAGRELLEALPRLPEPQKVEAIHHLTNLVDDDDYAPMSQLLANPETTSEIQDLLMADLLNRRNGVKLPALLEVARTPNHAKAAEAKEILRPYLQQDLTDDWTKNEMKLNLWLRDHPDS